MYKYSITIPALLLIPLLSIGYTNMNVCFQNLSGQSIKIQLITDSCGHMHANGNEIKVGSGYTIPSNATTRGHCFSMTHSDSNACDGTGQLTFGIIAYTKKNKSKIKQQCILQAFSHPSVYSLDRHGGNNCNFIERNHTYKTTSGFTVTIHAP